VRVSALHKSFRVSRPCRVHKSPDVVEPVHDPSALAKNVLSFCPDFYYQGIGLDPANHGADPMVVIEQNFRIERLVHFWWD